MRNTAFTNSIYFRPVGAQWCSAWFLDHLIRIARQIEHVTVPAEAFYGGSLKVVQSWLQPTISRWTIVQRKGIERGTRLCQSFDVCCCELALI